MSPGRPVAVALVLVEDWSLAGLPCDELGVERRPLADVSDLNASCELAAEADRWL
jgi:hypothetical protein